MNPSPLASYVADQIDEIVYLYEGRYTKEDLTRKIASALECLEKDNRDMRDILLRLHSARVSMNEVAVIETLNEVDRFFREENTN